MCDLCSLCLFSGVRYHAFWMFFCCITSKCLLLVSKKALLRCCIVGAFVFFCFWLNVAFIRFLVRVGVFFFLWLCIWVFYKLELFLFLRFQIAMTVPSSYVLLLFKMLPYRNLLCFCLTLARTDLRYLIRFVHVFCVCVFLLCSGGGIICSNHTFFALSIVKFRFRLYV